MEGEEPKFEEAVLSKRAVKRLQKQQLQARSPWPAPGGVGIYGAQGCGRSSGSAAVEVGYVDAVLPDWAHSMQSSPSSLASRSQGPLPTPF